MRAKSTLIHLDYEDFRNLDYDEYTAYVEYAVAKGMKYKAYMIIHHSLWRELREDNNDLFIKVLELEILAEETN